MFDVNIRELFGIDGFQFSVKLGYSVLGQQKEQV
jgi:hypothetical protein